MCTLLPHCTHTHIIYTIQVVGVRAFVETLYTRLHTQYNAYSIHIMYNRNFRKTYFIRKKRNAVFWFKNVTNTAKTERLASLRTAQYIIYKQLGSTKNKARLTHSPPWPILTVQNVHQKYQKFIFSRVFVFWIRACWILCKIHDK